MITISINEQTYKFYEQITLSDALARYFEQESKPTVFALAVNQNFVPQTQYATHRLSTGDIVDIFSPIQGG